MDYEILTYKDQIKLSDQYVETNNRKRTDRIKYNTTLCAFDIETTRLDDDQSIMYIWMFAITKDKVYIGRTWREFEYFLNNLLKVLPHDQRIVILDHNLSYEFSFLRGIYDFKAEEVYALKSRKVCKCWMHDRLEFRCTLIHSNMSLAEYTKKMNVKHQKLSGEEYDYSVTRYPDTPMTDEELRYCCHDVVGLIEAYEAEMSLESDNIATIPSTSTGYVRRECRRALKEYSRKAIIDSQPDAERYHMMKLSFRGGDTHASRFYSTRILENVESADRCSSYPDVMCNDIFPYGFGTMIKELNTSQFISFYERENYVFFAKCVFRNIRLRDHYWGFPYISFGKCVKFSSDYVLDNGRILSASYIELYITNVDFRIIEQTYTFDLECSELLSFPAHRLPEPLIEITQKYFTDKTSLKNVPEQQVYYDKQKNKLNSLYGMAATDPVRMEYVYDSENPNLFYVLEKNTEDILYQNRTHNFLLYQWGCFVTAWARYRLYEAQTIVGDDGVYCDTDSVKYISNPSVLEKLNKYNDTRIKKSTETKSFATDKHGEVHFMGVYEQERPYRRFVTFGAKKYAYEFEGDVDDNGVQNCHVTISGVNKHLGGIELKERGGLEALKEGFIFKKAGGVELVYNDTVPRHYETRDGHTFEMGANVCIKPSTYTMSLTNDYKQILSDPYLLDKIIHKLGIRDL